MARHQPLIVTLHGINSIGAWQDDVRQVFEPHFRCVPLRYPQFRRLGWLKIFSPWHRYRALKTVARNFAAEVGGAGVRPHLIAHSFGTWLAVRLMSRPGTRLRRIVFVGSPLPANFDWTTALADDPEAFYDLTNERGLLDGVISLAGRLSQARAGQAGFQGPPELIHDTRVMRDACPLCVGLVPQTHARIHNVDRDFRHSDWFVGNGHSANLWLPYFWGFPPEEYFDFIERCLLLDEMASQDVVNLRQAEEDFYARSWSWTRIDSAVVSLGEYVA
ncbi:MAG TPA: alpha/beta hydrolase, partial [Thermoanaerobaculia bacterium]